ncbi:GroES-like protein [Obba rivulosa]|uniref:GroES-like protein n=1 Tax=Obba rivulosa TaxID=1052685 RepID=A0A8E2AUI6_9APHY|nr:GroES-like protein [Obba rivulosa]
MATSQKALFLTDKHGDWVVNTTDVPAPDRGQLLVRIEATALNPVDWKIRESGLFVQRFPAVVGSDAAGSVDRVGEGVRDFAPGDKVLFQGFFNTVQGTFQQYALANADVTAKVPTNVSVDAAATVPLGLATAALGLFDQYCDASAKLFPPWDLGGRGKYAGQPFMVFGGSGSVGQYVIQLAHLAGFAPLIATASPHNAPHLQSLGATHVLDRALPADALQAEVRKITRAPIPVIYDAVAHATTQNAAYDVLAPGGRLVLTLPEQIDEAKKAAPPAKHVIHIVANVNLPERRKAGQSLYAKLSGLLEEGAIKPNRHEVLPNGLAGIPDGLERMKKGQVSAHKLVARPLETP